MKSTKTETGQEKRLGQENQAVQKKRTGQERRQETNGKTMEGESSVEEMRISVRRLVEFILRHGDIDNRHQASPDNAMQEGSRIHRLIQRRMGAEYQAEVPLKYSFPAEGYMLTVEGRADGIIHRNERIIIDEIKGTYRELAQMRGPLPLHLAQAKCYAYMYGVQEGVTEISVRMTYCNIFSEELRYFNEDITWRELEEWFQGILASYRKWSDYAWEWRHIREASIAGLAFPFPYRQGQKELVSNVYRTIYHKKKLFLEAPTGVGKTISTIYPAVQAMGRGMGEKLFYLTAKTITRTVAEDTLELLRERGLRMKSVILTAKEKICFMDHADCNPEYCPYAKGHYDRINAAVFELLTSEESFRRERIEEYAKKYQVCPFEMCLDMSLFADAVICDYNYLFDPHIYLKRFFGETSSGDYIFLIDEAHNLLERGREMYSALLWKEQFVELCREIKQTIVSEINMTQNKQDISGQITFDVEEKTTQSMTYNLTEEMTLSMTHISPDGDVDGGEGGGKEKDYREGTGNEDDGIEGSGMHIGMDFMAGQSESDDEWDEEGNVGEGGEPGDKGNKFHGGRSVLVRQGYGEKLLYWMKRCNQELLVLKRECPGSRIVESIEAFVQNLLRLQSVMDDYLSEQEEVQLPVREQVLNFYFEINHFLFIYDLLDVNYVKYTQICEDGSFFVKLLCVNPRENLKNCMLRGRSSILFSATFLPIQYYKKLLGGDKEDYEVYAQSVFNPAKRALLIAGDVTSKYTRRSQEEYYNMACYIEEIVKNRHGNYMVFCPSYAFLRIIYEIYVDNFGAEDRECMIQSEIMGEADRENFLEKFRKGVGRENMDQKNIDAKGIDMEIEGNAIKRETESRDRILIGFCVLGGIFSEGIDLKNDSLIGAIIIGTGLPQVCDEREILKSCFAKEGEDGFDYSYRYPGMNKVLQAAGRVIRTVEDVGIIALLDERFLQYAYRRLFPREWENFEVVTVDNVAGKVERFWNEWL